MKSLTYIAAIIGLSVLVGFSPAYAQNVLIVDMPEATSTPPQATTTPEAPDPLATTTEIITPAPVLEEPAVVDTIEEEPAPEPKPIPKPTPKPKPVVQPVLEEEPATTTASTTEFIPLALGTLLPGNIYRDAKHAPLNAETTLYLLGLSALCAMLGAFMIEKRRLDQLGAGIFALFSPLRPLPPTRAERQ